MDLNLNSFEEEDVIDKIIVKQIKAKIIKTIMMQDDNNSKEFDMIYS